jgi:hypothetical protein
MDLLPLRCLRHLCDVYILRRRQRASKLQINFIGSGGATATDVPFGAARQNGVCKPLRATNDICIPEGVYRIEEDVCGSCAVSKS